MLDYDRLEHKDENSKNIFVINWCLLNKCNYSCSYCTDYLHKGTDFPNLKNVMNFCKHVIDSKKGKTIFFEFTGGEVTYWKDFKYLIHFLKQYDNVYVGAISNGSNTLKWWEDIKDSLERVILSFHSEFANKEKYVKLVKYLSEYIHVHVNVMLHPDNFDLCMEVADELKNVPYISLSLQPLLIDFKDTFYDYSEKQLDVINNAFKFRVLKNKPASIKYLAIRGGMYIIDQKENKKILTTAHKLRYNSKGKNYWKGWNCAAGVEQIIINPKGEVYRGWCMINGKLGTIDKLFKLPENPIVCSSDICTCNFDIMSTKFKI